MRPDAPALGAVEAVGDAVCTASDVGSDVETLTPQADSNAAINAGIAARVVITFTPCSIGCRGAIVRRPHRVLRIASSVSAMIPTMASGSSTQVRWPVSTNTCRP